MKNTLPGRWRRLRWGRRWRRYLPLAIETYPPERRTDVESAVREVLAHRPSSPPTVMAPLYEPVLSPAILPAGVPRIYGLCGRPRAGKEMMSEYLSAHYRDVARIAFSEIIIAEVNTYLARHPQRGRCHFIVEENKSLPHYRHLLQAWGQARREENPLYWTEQIRRAITARLDAGARLVIATGARAPSEAELIRELGGELVRVVRPGYSYPAEHDAEHGLDYLPDSAFTTVINAVEGDPAVYEANIEAALRGLPQRYGPPLT